MRLWATANGLADRATSVASALHRHEAACRIVSLRAIIHQLDHSAPQSFGTARFGIMVKLGEGMRREAHRCVAVNRPVGDEQCASGPRISDGLRPKAE